MTKNVLYYHTYLTDDTGVWSSIFMEHAKLIEDNGLLPHIHDVRITAISQRDMRAEAFNSLCRHYFPKCQITFIVNPYRNDFEMVSNLNSSKTVSENETIRRIWNDSFKEDMNILYLHSKGITSYIRHLQQGDIETFINYHYWRQYLNWGVIENWRTMVSALDTHDIAGVNFYKSPAPHFSGAYWWTTSEHVKTLPDPATLDWWYKLINNSNSRWLKTMASDRFRDEMWPCQRENTKIFRFNQLLEKDNPARNYLPRLKYSQSIDDVVFQNDINTDHLI